jgi:hypothetical protein
MAEEQMGRYNTSDKLAIALACLAGVMAIILFLVEKTPGTVLGLLAAMFLLLIYPILHFAKSGVVRIGLLLFAVVGTIYFGWLVWPSKHQPPAEQTASNAPKSSSQGVPSESKNEAPPSTAKPDPKTKKIAKSKPTPPSQDCPNGICIGGDNNGKAEVNNYAPIPKIETTIVSENTPSEGSFQTTIGISSTVPVPTLYVSAEGDSVTTAACITAGNGGFGRSGNGVAAVNSKVTCKYLNALAGLSMTVISGKPEQLRVTYQCEGAACQ